MLEYKKYLHRERAQDSRFILEQSTRNFAKISQSDSKSIPNRLECAFLREFYCIISVFLVSVIFNLYNKAVRVLAVNYVFCFKCTRVFLFLERIYSLEPNLFLFTFANETGLCLYTLIGPCSRAP